MAAGRSDMADQRVLLPGLRDKVCLITGGAAGIGNAIARGFAGQGATPVIVDISAERLEEAAATIASAGVRCQSIVADVTVDADVVRTVSEVEREHGHLDVLVNNVGNSYGLLKPFADSNPDDWDRLYQVNLRHVFRFTQLAIPLLMRSDGSGSRSVINISTIEAHRGFPGGVAYSSFKAAMSGFTRSLGVELAPHGIRVNEIAPETTATWSVPITNWLPESESGQIRQWVPLGRFGVPDDAAGCALFLASDLAGWMTGTTLHLDGGCLPAGAWVRTPEGNWTHRPAIIGSRWPPRRAERPVAD